MNCLLTVLNAFSKSTCRTWFSFLVEDFQVKYEKHHANLTPLVVTAPTLRLLYANINHLVTSTFHREPTVLGAVRLLQHNQCSTEETKSIVVRDICFRYHISIVRRIQSLSLISLGSHAFSTLRRNTNKTCLDK